MFLGIKFTWIFSKMLKTSTAGLVVVFRRGFISRATTPASLRVFKRCRDMDAVGDDAKKHRYLVYSGPRGRMWGSHYGLWSMGAFRLRQFFISQASLKVVKSCQEISSRDIRDSFFKKRRSMSNLFGTS